VTYSLRPMGCVCERDGQQDHDADEVHRQHVTLRDLGRVAIKQVADCVSFCVRSSPPKQTFASTIGKVCLGRCAIGLDVP
jgi:hypothetical protein